MPRPLILVAISLLALAGCAEDEIKLPVFQVFVLSQFELDRASSFGRDGPIGDAFRRFAEDVDTMVTCDAPTPLILELNGVTQAGDARGELRVRSGEDADGDRSNDCSGDGVFRYSETGTDGRGPFVIEGRQLAARLDLEAAIGNPTGRYFPEWLDLRGEIAPGASNIDFGRATFVWTARVLFEQLDSGFRRLDGLTYLGLRPDVDRDGDGLERFIDENSDATIDVCIDGDGTRVEGPTCPRDARFADGFSGAFLFRVEAATLEL